MNSRVLLVAFAAMAFLFSPNPAWAMQTQEVDIGRNGVYDGVVKIVRDERGRMTLRDSETSPVTLSDLRYNGMAHWLLLGLDGDDHPQYLNAARAKAWLAGRSTSDLPEGSGLYYTDTRARQAIGAQTPLKYSSSTGVVSIDPVTSPTFTGLALSGLPAGAIACTGPGGKLVANTSRISILDSGYVGIGTNAPAARLDVFTSGTGYIPGGQIRGGIDPGNGATRFMVANPQSSFMMSAYGSAAPGILVNSAGISAGPGAGGSFIICSSAARPIRIFSNNQYTLGNHLVIDTTGYVGVGTDAPSARLDVNGAGRVRGALSIDGMTTAASLNVIGALRVASSAQVITTNAQTLSCSRGLILASPIGDRDMNSCPTITPGGEGQIIVITNQSTDGYLRLSGEALLPGSKLSLGAGARTLYWRDTLTLIYAGDCWREIGYSSNQ